MHLHIDFKAILLIQSMVVVLVPFLIWWGLRLQPIFPLAVVQIFGGVLLGPSFLEAFLPDVYNFLFAPKCLGPNSPVNCQSGINSIAIIAVCLFSFLAGTEADKNLIRNAGPSVFSMGVGGFLLTAGIGAALGYALVEAYPSLKESVVTIAGQKTTVAPASLLFALAFGLACAVPALPILAAILTDMKISGKKIGAVSLAAAGLGDALLWASVAAIVPIGKALTSSVGGEAVSSGAVALAVVTAVTGGLAAISLCQFIMTPILNRLMATGAQEKIILTVVGVTVFACSAITSMVELHPVMGAFISGIFLPDKVRHLVQKRLDLPTAVLLLPFFFLSVGLRTNLTEATDAFVPMFLSMLFVVIFGKIVSTALFARLTGENWAFGGAVGLLLQTKGLMMLVVATILADANIVSKETFTAFIFAALLSTALTKPAMRVYLHYFGEAIDASGAKPTVKPVHAPATTRDPSILAYITVNDPTLLEADPDLKLIEIRKPRLIIGRHSTDDVSLPDLRVSRHHAMLRQNADGHFEIVNQTASRADPRDMTVNGEVVSEARLKDGDKIALGGVEFEFNEAHAAKAAA